MVYWIYVIECEDDYIYIGQTMRLYRRFNEHITCNNGSVNTSRHRPKRLIGLYKVGDNYSFSLYRNSIRNNEYDRRIIYYWGRDEETGKLDVENHIVEMYKYFKRNNGEWQKVNGGKYTQYKQINPTLKMLVEDINDRPYCYCKYPSEVKLSTDKKTIYFVCSLKNIWEDFYQGLDAESPCDFFKVYDEDAYVKKRYDLNEAKLKEPWCEKLPVAFEECIKCKKIQYEMVYALGHRRQLCQSCFSLKYEELKKEYSMTECLITDD